MTWPPFVLVAGLLLIGGVAAEDGLFEALGGRIARARMGPRALLLALLAPVAVVTAVLNLDTAVVFLTPVLVHAARRRGLDERPFLYGSVFMANSGSLLLPGSNLTNLLVLRGRSDGIAFAARMLPPWLAACAVTAGFLALVYPLGNGAPAAGKPPPLRLGLGASAVLGAAILVIALPNAALPVLALGLVATALRRVRPAVGVRSLAFLFALAVCLGTVGRVWPGLETAVGSGSAWTTAAAGAVASIVVNNLPAAVLLSSRPPLHPYALLLGLNLGPNLALTGSLSALLWLRAARSLGARPSIATYTKLGLVVVPSNLAASAAALLTCRIH